MREDVGAFASAIAIAAFIAAGVYLGLAWFKPAPQDTAFNLPPIERVFPNSVPALPR